MSRPESFASRVAILHPLDPAGSVPSGIDSFVRGILKFAPPDISYTLFGATSDAVARPPFEEAQLELGNRPVSFIPLVTMNANAHRGLIPLTVRYMAGLARAISRERLNDFDVLDFHRIEPSLLFPRDRRPKNLLLHQDMSVIRDPNSDILWRHAPWIYENVERYTFSKMQRIFAVRKSAVERYRLIYPTLANRFSFIPTWVDSTVFGPCASESDRENVRRLLREQIGAKKNSVILAFVGRLDQQKDPHLLIETFQLCATQDLDMHLVIVGDGVLRRAVEQRVVEAGLQARIHFWGVRQPVEIARILRASDLFVLSSAYEGMPIAVLEALATGLPVVSTDVGEIRLAVRDGVNGRISQNRLPATIAHCIQRALTSLEAIRGVACESAVAPYHPRAVLAQIYDNHRVQSRPTARQD